MSEVTFNHFDTVPWVDENKKKAVPAEVIADAAKAGARRKMLAQGETGIYVQYSELPANFRIDAHAHSHDEVITLLSGSCTVDGGTTMRANDAVCIKGGTVYGFTAGPEGMVFLTIRGGDSVTNYAN
jgi:quercetin dioxygenase-like cupin family protein